jgi:two-component system response regulator FixJ
MNEQDAIIYVVDDDAVIRRSLVYLFDSVGWRVQAFDSARAFLDGYDGHQPGCIILDIRMPMMSGLELQQELNARHVALPIIFLTGHGDVTLAVHAMKAGACDFLEKPYKEQMLLDLVERTVRRSAEAFRAHTQQRALLSAMAALTAREREVAERVAAGKSSKVIARELDISDKTVQVHRQHAMEKLGVHSATELARLLMRAGQGPGERG